MPGMKDMNSTIFKYSKGSACLGASLFLGEELFAFISLILFSQKTEIFGAIEITYVNYDLFSISDSGKGHGSDSQIRR